MAIRIILAEGQGMVREGIRALLEADPAYEVVGEASHGREAVQRVLAMSPDLVIMDVALAFLNGVEVTRQVKDALPTVRVMALSSQTNRQVVGQMLQAGASGYVLKTASFQELRQAVERVLLGETYLSSEVANIVVEHFVRGNGNGGEAHHAVLTPREREVLQLLAEGYGTREIAEQLNISVKTIDTHRHQVMKKLQFRGLADLTRYALREGITTLNQETPAER